MKLFFLFLATLFLSACATTDGPGWSIGPWVQGKNSSVGMPLVPAPVQDGVWQITINPGTSVHGITMERGPLTTGIHIKYRVEGEGLFPTEDPEAAPILTLYFQRDGDNWSTKGKYAYYRYYTIAPLPLTPGEHEATVPFDPKLWTCVIGQPADAAPDKMAEAMAKSGRVGMGFGHWNGRMHGLGTNAPVTVTILEWSAQ
jgi:hypothetical protein